MFNSVLSKSEIFDLYATDREIRRSCGIGLLPPLVYKIFEKAIFVGLDTLDGDEVKEAFDALNSLRDSFEPYTEKNGGVQCTATINSVIAQIDEQENNRAEE